MEVSLNSSSNTSHKFEQFTGRSGIQGKVISSPGIIEKEWKIKTWQLFPESGINILISKLFFVFGILFIATKQAIGLNIIISIPILGFNTLCRYGVCL